MIDDPETRRSHYRWVICALLFSATTINYVDRQVFSVLGPNLTEEFHWTERDFSAIVNAFTLAYAIGYLVVGRMMDRIGVRAGLVLAVTVWSLAAMAHGLVGIGGTAAGLGMLVLSTLVGRILDWTQAAYGEKDYLIPFIIAGSAYLVATAVIHLLLPRLEPMEYEARADPLARLVEEITYSPVLRIQGTLGAKRMGPRRILVQFGFSLFLLFFTGSMLAADAAVVDVKSQGAAGDGKTKDTPAIRDVKGLTLKDVEIRPKQGVPMTQENVK